ncbi:CHAT domain-containing protein [Coprinopsis sp. MPI-PUGE-AT-0042]|nr:CHAT domain-containing protein [Coprinopsis sp. MPI-PUGE-AT-0042]
MGQENSSLVPQHASGGGGLYLTDIVIECTDTASDSGLLLSLTELWVFGIPDSEDGKCYTLTNGNPGQWHMTNFITLPAGVAGIDCVVKNKAGEDVAFVHLDHTEMQSAHMHSEHGNSQSMQMCGESGHLIISWKEMEIPLDIMLPAEDITNLNDSGVGLMRQFERTGDIETVTEAIAVLHRVVQLTPKGHVDLPGRLNNLASLFQGRFEHTGELSDIDKAISAQCRAMQLTPEGHADLPGFLTNLGLYFRCRFERTGDLSDIAEAVSAQHRAVHITPEGHAHLPSFLNNLGISLQCRFECTGDVLDIAKAISAHRRALQLAPEGHADLPVYLNNLATSFQGCFRHTEDLSDLAEAISAQQRAVQLTPEHHAKLPGFLTNLGSCFMYRFERTGDVSDIAEAISAQRRAVQLTPEGHAHLSAFLNNLGISFQCRFERTGNGSDMAEAIAAQHRAVELTPMGHADLPNRLSNLGNSYRCLFQFSGDVSDITEAISAQHRGVQLTPEGHANFPGFLNNLGISFQCRFKLTGDLSDITEAISAQQRAVQLTPTGHAELSGRLSSLGNSFQCRFERTRDLSNITEAISAQHRAVQLTPEGHAKLPGRLSNLGTSFQCRFELTHSGEDLVASISNYKSAATSSFGPPWQQLQAARSWAKLLNQHHPQSPDILHAFDVALALIALIAGLEESVQGRYSRLQDISGIALEAASAACSFGRADKALEWLEQGRCIVWSQLSNLRTPIDNLRLYNSELAQRIADVAKHLEDAGSSRGQPHKDMSASEKLLLEDEARAHLNLARQWDDLLKTVRSIPGFESFLQPLPCSSLLQHLPASGPVVVINVDKQRCDAIALLAGLDEPLHIPLPNFSLEKANKYRSDLKATLEDKHLRMQEVQEITDEEPSGRGVKPPKENQAQSFVVRTVLRDLWKEVLSPILNALGFSRMDPLSGNALPRIWWCPTGPLSFLPIHAAGIHSDRVLDYAVSSYIPTITALIKRVKNHQQINKGASGLFLTSQPNARDASSIPGTTKEVQSIFRMAAQNGARAAMLQGSTLTVDECLQYMEHYSCIHLACHALQNAAKPLESQFLFHNGSLNLANIIQRDLKNADLAFLSACQTSTGDEKLSDEAVHLAAGMLAAGYHRVVATMWSIGDENAPEVANSFYNCLFSHREEGSGSSVDGSNSAYALHHAVQQLRQRLDNSESSLLAWAPYVHFGY